MQTIEQERDAARVAFDKAIKEGRLSDNKNKWNYAGDFMYMGVGAGSVDLFKHRETRNYIGALPLRWEVMK